MYPTGAILRLWLGGWRSGSMCCAILWWSAETPMSRPCPGLTTLHPDAPRLHTLGKPRFDVLVSPRLHVLHASRLHAPALRLCIGITKTPCFGFTGLLSGCSKNPRPPCTEPLSLFMHQDSVCSPRPVLDTPNLSWMNQDAPRKPMNTINNLYWFPHHPSPHHRCTSTESTGTV